MIYDIEWRNGFKVSTEITMQQVTGRRRGTSVFLDMMNQRVFVERGEITSVTFVTFVIDGIFNVATNMARIIYRIL